MYYFPERILPLNSREQQSSRISFIKYGKSIHCVCTLRDAQRLVSQRIRRQHWREPFINPLWIQASLDCSFRVESFSLDYKGPNRFQTWIKVSRRDFKTAITKNFLLISELQLYVLSLRVTRCLICLYRHKSLMQWRYRFQLFRHEACFTLLNSRRALTMQRQSIHAVVCLSYPTVESVFL